MGGRKGKEGAMGDVKEKGKREKKGKGVARGQRM